jgi:alpha-tubulin suppressor-like RCC1 family protein
VRACLLLLVISSVAVVVRAEVPLFSAIPGASPPSGQAYEWGSDNQVGGRAAALAQLSDAVLVSGNSSWSLALKADGRLEAWGSNRNGQTNVPSGSNDRFVHAAAGWQHGIACRDDGTVEEWGNPYGNTEAQWEARRPPINTCVQVAAGDNHSAALLADGTVVTWGGRTAVTRMSGVITDATQIASGWYAVIALRRDGSVTVFGAVSNPGEYLDPPPGLSDVVRVAASSQASFYAIRADGTLVAWGSPDTYGQLTPPPSATNLIDVAGGRYHTLALRADGTIVAWGDNSTGQLNVPAGIGRVIAVGAGRYHSQAIVASP